MAMETYSGRKGKKCVLYLRVSLERQVEGFSLEGQNGTCGSGPNLRA